MSKLAQAMLHVGSLGAGAAAVGLVLGLVLWERFLPCVIYGVAVCDLPTTLLDVLTLSLIAIIATVIPTLKIASIDPAKTLREELRPIGLRSRGGTK